jgi:hypothetical protein
MRLPTINASRRMLILTAFALSLLPIDGSASELRQQIIAGFSAKRGQEIFLSRPATGKPDTPSCTSCHSTDPAQKGRTRAGKEIAPMAVSKTPERYTDFKKVEKWFRRNCKGVLGRTCTAMEKGDFLTFMSNQ